ncbi:hypothetical protein S245_013333, partial [Arachis hypogaea]
KIRTVELEGKTIKLQIVVPTIYKDIRGHVTYSNQYSVTEHFKSSEQGAVPGVFFFYDISPIKSGKGRRYPSQVDSESLRLKKLKEDCLLETL